MLRLFIDVKNKVHDASGIENPNQFYWTKVSDIYFPIKEISEEELHEEIRDFIDENNLPQISLDEIDLNKFNEKQMEYRNFLMDLFYTFL